MSWFALLLACVDPPPTGTATPPPGTEPVETGDTGTPTLCEPEVTGGDGVVVTSTGAFQGVASGTGWNHLGIPYAQPPVGPLRWMPPQAPSCETVLQQATAFGPRCPQWNEDRDAVLGDEDCLTLNVFAPEDAADLPVLVFIHGGANQQGSASQERLGVHAYDGTLLAARTGSVVVTLNYRLGALGFLAHPELDDGTGGAGNHGLRDQLAALAWVRREIGAFGGDPARVMVFGESAGARNTCSLVASPLGAGLFDAALMQSGSCREKARAARESEAVAWTEQGPCAGSPEVATCLRALDAAAIVEATPPDPINEIGLVQESFGPTVDGVVLPLDPEEAIAMGVHNDVPLVFGANAEETGTWLLTPVSDQAYEATLIAVVGGTFGLAAAQQARQVYPLEDFDSAQDALIAVTTDAQFVCPSRRLARLAAEHQQAPVFRYFYDHAMSGIYGIPGAAHGVELLYVFQQLDASVYPARPEDLQVEALLGTHWSGLAANGEPGAPWTAYDPELDNTMVLSTDPGMQDGIRSARCDFWDSLMP